MACPTCAFSNVRIHCLECNWHFRSHMCFTNHKQITKQKRSVCERKRFCETCGWVVTRGNHLRFCDNCKENNEVSHLCYMRTLKDALPSASDKILYFFYDFETTQNTEYTAEAKLHVPNLVCVHQFCSRCEDMEDSLRCDKRIHSF